MSCGAWVPYDPWMTVPDRQPSPKRARPRLLNYVPLLRTVPAIVNLIHRGTTAHESAYLRALNNELALKLQSSETARKTYVVNDDYLEKMVAAREEVQSDFRNRPLALLAIAAFTYGGLELAYNVMMAANEKVFYLNTIAFVAVNPTDSAVIVAGMLTVVAALNIALAGWPSDPSQSSPEDFAMGASWAERIGTVANLSADVAVLTALSRIPHAKDDIAATFVLVMLAALCVLLSTAVVDWKSSRLPERFLLKKGIERFKCGLDAWRQQTPSDVWSAQKTRRLAIRFVATIALCGGATVIGLGLLEGFRTTLLRAVLTFTFVTLMVAYFMPLLVSFTLRAWIDTGMRPDDRRGYRVFQWLYVVMVTTILTLPFASVTRQSGKLWSIWAVIELFGVALPLVLLYQARKAGKQLLRSGRRPRRIGPAEFILHMRILRAEKIHKGMVERHSRLDPGE